ncbi:MAG: hypothetical protein ACI4MQ_05525 [Candidatus Coproplasma sp.]
MAAKTILKLTYILISSILILLGGQAFLPTYAAVQNYSNVLTDLQKDESFNAADYPIDKSDYSLQVIQIAESMDGELFLYTYQPCQPTQYLVATSVNMSLSESVDGTKLYSLTLLSSSGVFCKYLVNGVTVSTDETRYYNISSIFREWMQGIDEEPPEGQTINEKSFKVGQLWTVRTLDGVVSYGMTGTQVLEITPNNRHDGYIEYSNGFKFYIDKCHSHYIAFTATLKGEIMPIDKLKEAVVYYVSQTYARSYAYSILYNEELGDPVENTVKLSETDEVTTKADGWFAKKYSWNRIESVSDFIANENLSDEDISNLQGKQWVLRFAETPYTVVGDYKMQQRCGTIVSDVTVLRLEFETNGETYNLGVVSDKVTVNKKPTIGLLDQLCNWLESVTGVPAIVWKIIIIATPILIVLGVLSAIFPVVWTVVKFVVKGLWLIIKYISIGLWYVISAPFRLIIWLVKRRQDDTQTE